DSATLRVRDLSGKVLFTRSIGRPTTIALNGASVAWGEVIDELVPYVRLRTIRTRRTKTLGRNSLGGIGGWAYQTSAQFLGNHLYWLEPSIGEAGGFPNIARLRLDARHPNCSWAKRNIANKARDVVNSLAIDPPAVYYTYGDEASGIDGVHQTTLAALRFARPDPWRCP
nr:hypothetical protein [Baekduia sp.]